MDGLRRYAVDYHEGDMEKASKILLAVLSIAGTGNMGGETYRELRGQILEDNGEPKAKYMGMEGQNRYTVDHHGGDKKLALDITKAVLTPEEFEKLRWESSPGSSE